MHVKLGIERFCEVERFFASRAFLLQNGRTTNYQIDHHSNEQKSPSSRNLLYKGFSRFFALGLTYYILDTLGTALCQEQSV